MTPAAPLAERGCLGPGPQHTFFFRRGERPRPRLTDPAADVIGDTAMSKIMAEIGALGDPPGQGGFGDEQGMRIMMLQARLGRRGRSGRAAPCRFPPGSTWPWQP